MKKSLTKTILFFVVTSLLIWSCSTNRFKKPERQLYGVGHAYKPLLEEERDKIANYFSVVEGTFLKEDMDAIRHINPEIKFIHYINSTYTGINDYDEMKLIESQYRDAIEMCLVGSLAGSIDKNSTHLRIQPVNSELLLRPSNIQGDLSVSTKKYVTWIQVGKEYMRVEKVDTITNTLQVSRGFSGTIPIEYEKGVLIFAPIYIGWKGWKGYPEAENEANLRYALKVNSKRIYKYKADILKYYLNEGYDGAKFDILGFVFYNMSSAKGTQVYPWNFIKNAPYSVDDYLRMQEEKIAFIQNYIFDQHGVYPTLFGNSLSLREFYPEDGGSMYFMKSTSVKPRTMEGFQMENFVSVVKGNSFGELEYWKQKVNMLIYSAKHGMGSVALIQFRNIHNIYQNLDSSIQQHELFGYASYLLGIEVEESTYIGTPVFMELPERRGKTVSLFPQYLYQLGNPSESFDSVDGYKHDDTDIYIRHYSNGLVMVNPSKLDIPGITLDRTFLDPNTGEKIKTISLKAHTGKLLLIE